MAAGTVLGTMTSGGYGRTVAMGFTFEDAAVPSAIPECEIPIEGGHLSGVGVVFGPITLPDTLTVTVKDSLGVTIASGTLTATGRLESFSPAPFVGALTVALTGNTTASAVGNVTLYAF